MWYLQNVTIILGALFTVEVKNISPFSSSKHIIQVTKPERQQEFVPKTEYRSLISIVFWPKWMKVRLSQVWTSEEMQSVPTYFPWRLLTWRSGVGLLGASGSFSSSPLWDHAELPTDTRERAAKCCGVCCCPTYLIIFYKFCLWILRCIKQRTKGKMKGKEEGGRQAGRKGGRQDSRVNKAPSCLAVSLSPG